MLTRIGIVFAALLALLAGVQTLRLYSTRAELEALRAGQALCAEVNQQQTRKIAELAALNNALVARNAADLAKAQEAASEYLLLEAEYEALAKENERLREQQATHDPAMASWLSAGMDHRVACSLWRNPAHCAD